MNTRSIDWTKAKRHLACAIAFTIQAAFVAFALLVWLAAVGMGCVALYVGVTNYGWLSMLATMGLIAVAFGLLILIAMFLVWLVDWVDSQDCRI